jgi:hypothetical protein
MGHTTDAHCFACGYDTALRIGGTRSSFETYSPSPVVCDQCREITTANIRSVPLVCLKCSSARVTDIKLHKLDGNDEVDKYRCPKCAAYELRFGTNVGKHRMMFFD